MKSSGFFPKSVVRWTALAATSALFSASLVRARSHPVPADVAQLVVDTGRVGCTVELDAAVVGQTDLQGHLRIEKVEAGDHYVHVRCPDDKQGTAYYVSPRAGGTAKVEHTPATAANTLADDSAEPGLEPVEARMKLRQLVQQAVQMRSRGRFDEAVRALHEATQLDPENSDLHRELGITFLLNRDWKRARVEMIEAIRHDPGDADAHNGLGYALEKLGHTQAALNEYRIATHLDPDDPSYREHYIEALGRLSEEQAATKKK